MQNGFALLARFAWPLTLLALILTVFAQATLARDAGLAEITVPKKLKKRLKSFEPSAAILLDDGGFLISSDDTTEEDEAMLFLMDADGKVDKEPVAIEGLEKMTDIESLSADGGYVYAMGSQSRNKKGKEKEERNRFVRGKLDGHSVTETSAIELRSQLLRALPGVRELSAVKGKLNQKLEIEASFVKGGHLFVGLKDPQPRPGVGLLLDLGPAAELFRGGQLRSQAIRVVAELDFEAAGGGEAKISDLAPHERGLLVAATLEEGGSSVFSYADGELRRLEEFPSHQAEGLAPTGNGEALVVFDQGENAALFSRLRF